MFANQRIYKRNAYLVGRVSSYPEINRYLEKYGERVIFAIGYARDFDISISVDGDMINRCDVDAYDTQTGEILYNKELYGIGIAFPQVSNLKVCLPVRYRVN